MAADKQQAHKLLDQLNSEQLDAIAKLLEVLVCEDSAENLTAEDARKIAASRDYCQNNPEGGISFEQVVANCGLTMDQIRGHSGE